MQKIMSKENKTFKYIQKLSKSSKYRKEEKLYLIEGFRLCKDALLSKTKIEMLIVSVNGYEKYFNLATEINLICSKFFVVNDSLFEQLSDTITPQGIMCVCNMCDNHFDILKYNKCKFFALENIQDPINLGTIIRTAEALGIDGLILSSDCCDVYSPKVLRGSMGAIFRIPLFFVSDFTSFIKLLQNNNFTCFASTPQNNAINVTKINFKEYDKSIIFIGNEGNGLTPITLNYCDYKITIPMLSKAESLNASVAASILMWEMLRN